MPSTAPAIGTSIAFILHQLGMRSLFLDKGLNRYRARCGHCISHDGNGYV